MWLLFSNIDRECDILLKILLFKWSTRNFGSWWWFREWVTDLHCFSKIHAVNWNWVFINYLTQFGWSSRDTTKHSKQSSLNPTMNMPEASIQQSIVINMLHKNAHQLTVVHGENDDTNIQRKRRSVTQLSLPLMSVYLIILQQHGIW